MPRPPTGSTGLANEWDQWSGSGPRNWVIVRYESTGTPRFKLGSMGSDITAVDYNTSSGGDIVGPTIFGHNASIPGVTTAAVPYNNSTTLEEYSSFGPATYCWQPVTGPTPSGPLTPCQSATVDVAATDGGQNSFFGGGTPHRFYGTSAAAPHAAAVAALMMQGQTCLSPDAVTAALKSSGRAVGTAPVDGAGAGLIDAVAAVTAGDCEAPATATGLGSGWYRTPTVSATATAQDNRVVTALTCTGATTQAATGLNTKSASRGWSVTGDGQHSVACSAKDLKGNTGPATVNFGIDSVAPAVTCRPTTVPLRRGGTVTADITDKVSGPASPTASATVSAPKPGKFAVTLSGADIAGNSASASCGYTVAVVPLLKGPSKAKAGAKPTFTVSGLPTKAKVTWTIKGGGHKTTKKTKANKAGVAKLKVKLVGKGKYVITSKAAGAKVHLTVRVR